MGLDLKQEKKKSFLLGNKTTTRMKIHDCIEFRCVYRLLFFFILYCSRFHLPECHIWSGLRQLFMCVFV